tara:strand:+ start:207 stop:1283 length:1077 start_codon:yes stop_codon:yes gene_type:complete
MSYTNINKSSEHFNTKLWTGNGSSPRSLSGLEFQPDLVWSKRRDDAAGHNLFDTVRGAGSDKNLQSNGTGVEGSGLPATFGYLSAFTSDGFTVTAGSSDNAYWNNNSATYVAWNWKANGTGVANTDGSINSTVSANTTSGFSIVKFTGTGATATVGHGLGVAPSFYVIKRIDGGDGGQWNCYHKSLGATKYMLLNSTSASGTSATRWNDTAPTSSVFTVNTSGDVNDSGDTHIAYCFAEKQGYSKFGSYQGSGNVDGPMIWLGFKPVMVITKCTNTTGKNWEIRDSKRKSDMNTANAYRLFPNLSDAEQTNTEAMDFLSNGFKLRSSSSGHNGNFNYIYMAFAEAPLVGSNNVPCTAG